MLAFNSVTVEGIIFRSCTSFLLDQKPLPRRKQRTSTLTEDSSKTEMDNPHGKRAKKEKIGRKSNKNRGRFDRDHSNGHSSGGLPNKSAKASNETKHQDESLPEPSFIRKLVDPETTRYYSEIANVIESNEIDLEERLVICGSALEESKGKEVELATDYIISHAMQSLLEGCDLDHLCGFLQSCANDFPCIAMDRSGSHVAETALKALTVHLQENESRGLVEDTLTMICQVIVENPVQMMCNCHGSHVLRSLLCLCKGVPLDSPEFHATKSSIVLAERLNFRHSQSDIKDPQFLQPGFPDLLVFLVSEMLRCSKRDISILQADQFSSLVLQTALKLLSGQEEVLGRIIPVLLGCDMENAGEKNFIETISVQNLLSLTKESAYSHLMEVILEVAPETLYNELFTKVFQNSLFQMSSHNCGNFVVQSLISHARCQNHMELICEELGSKFEDLLRMGRSGVVASVIAASQRLHSFELKCSQALSAAVCSDNESFGLLVPRLLFLDSYFSCNDVSNWNWPNDVKMHIMGSLILQLVFKYPSEMILPYISSIASMETDHILVASKDSGGQRVIEAFLSSSASSKFKRRLVAKLRGHFAELAMHSSGSFTVEKCFNVSNISLKEEIVSELSAVQNELSKAKQGPLLLRKLDVEGFSRRPDEWKLRQTSKQSTYKEFYATFGSKKMRKDKPKIDKTENFLSETPHTSQPEKLKMRKEINTGLASASSVPFLSNKISKYKKRKSSDKHHVKRSDELSDTFTKHTGDVFSQSNKKQKKKYNHGGS